MNVERLLVRGVNWLGDAVMCTPALQRLREAHPRASIALVAPGKLADLWKHHPAVDLALALEPGESVWSVAKRLRRHTFDAALVLPNSHRAALEVYFAGIPRRVGLARPWRNALLTHVVATREHAVRMRKRPVAEIQRLIASNPPRARTTFPPTAHQLHDHLHLAAALGADPQPVPPRLFVLDSEVEAVCERFGGADPSGLRGPLLGLNAGAEYGPAKRWPRERFVEVAVTLQRELDARWWIFGGANDVALAAQIVREIQSAKAASPDRVQCLAGQTTLRELCAALKACDTLLTNDTGPAHVAAAVGTSVVALFGSTAPELTAPGLPGDTRHALLRGAAPCAPCFLRECPIDFRCMTALSAEAVSNAVRQAAGHGGISVGASRCDDKRKGTNE